MLRTFAALLFVLPLAAEEKAVGDLPPPRQEVALLAALPDQLGGFRRTGRVSDFAQTANDARLGAAVEFRSGNGIVATVYLYDAGRRDIGGPGTPALLDQQLAQAVDDVRRAGAIRRYTVEGERPMVAAGLRCSIMRLAFLSGPVNESAACLGTRAPFFLKLRVTTPPAAAGTLTAQLEPFAAAVTAALR